MRFVNRAWVYVVAALALRLAVSSVPAQGTLFVDQASGTLDEIVTTSTSIPDFGSVAQSFTPALQSVGFIQLQEFVSASSPGHAATLVINLRQGSVNGPIISSTDPVILVNLGTMNGTFYFPQNIPVTAGQLYFFEPVVQSSGTVDVAFKSPSSYDRGDLFGNGLPSGGISDLWFREGIVVPEPSVLILAMIGGLFFFFSWRNRRNQH